MNLSSSDIAKITNGRLSGPADLIISDLLTDSRQANPSAESAFVAIEGKNHDGHQYIESLYRKGVRVFIAKRLPEKINEFPDAAFIVTVDTVSALQSLAAYKRQLFKSTVIAVTGSAGKTIVKEWLADILGQATQVVRSPKSYNSQIGVPLSVWKLEDKFRYGIFEAGISLPGEMENLRKVIDPDIGIITNIGDAHSENFRDNRSKAKEKLKLFRDSSTIVFCRDHKVIRDLIMEDKLLRSKTLADWSLHDPESAIFVRKVLQNDERTELEIVFGKETVSFLIPFTDRASIENAITVASACMVLGMDRDLMARGFSQLSPVAMRMELKNGINNCQLIEDYYNSDPGSLMMALEYLKAKSSKSSTLILSDFIQSGRKEPELYSEVADQLKKAGIDRFIGIGPALKRNSALFSRNSRFCLTTEDFIRDINIQEFRNEIILLKGARIFELEKIGRLLESQVHTTVLEINLDAISHNINEIRRHLNPGTRIMAMVKAFAYGAGPSEIAGLMEYHRVSYLGVAYSDEGAELRNAGVTMPVMVMNPDPSSAELMIKYNLEPEIYSFSSLNEFTGAASRHGLYQYPVHLKIDTGMHRLGFLPGEIERLALRIKDLDCIKVTSVFSHLAGSEDPAFDKFTHKQASVFIEAASKIQATLGYPFLKHILNTSGILRFPEYQFDMVRPGIGLYGAGIHQGIDLKPASRFKTRISQVKKIPAGDPVGYGCADISDNPRIIAILPVGYADGLDRRAGNRNGSLWIKSRRVPLIGNICMDMCMADITGTGAEEGDDAEIFGQNIPINEVAEKCGTIPYEILTSIPARVKRVFFRE